MTRSALMLAAVAALSFTASPAAAQLVESNTPATPRASSTKGLFLGVHLNGSAVNIDDLSPDTESGGGIGVHAGYGFTPNLALVLEATAARLDLEGDETMLAHVDLSLRYAFTSPTRRFVPYVEAGYAGRALAANDVMWVEDDMIYEADLSLSGAGPSLGGGFHYYLSPTLAFGAGLKWMGGEFDEITIDDVSVSGLGLDASSTRVNLTLTWFPGGGR